MVSDMMEHERGRPAGISHRGGRGSYLAEEEIEVAQSKQTESYNGTGVV